MLDASQDFSNMTGEKMVEQERKKSILIARIEDAARRDSLRGDNNNNESGKERRISLQSQKNKRNETIKKTIESNPEKYSKYFRDYQKEYYHLKTKNDETFMKKKRELSLARYYKKKEEKRLLTLHCINL